MSEGIHRTDGTHAVWQRIRDSHWGAWLLIGGLGILWIDLFRQLSYQWMAKEQYSYGWFVPALSVALLWQRWMTRPAPSAPGWRAVSIVTVSLAAAALLPLRIVHETNPDWPGLSWILALALITVTMGTLHAIGGRSWTRHLLFPVCFSLVAVRWPWRIEQPLTLVLMNNVTSVAVEVLGWFNTPAIQQGNLIQLGSMTVGVDEACSGIRSLQASMMVTLFLGELYLLRWAARIVLVLCGAGLAIGLNVSRTLVLSWSAAAAGLPGIERWHDVTGISLFLVLLSSLWWLAHRFGRLRPAIATARSVAPAVRPGPWLGGAVFVGALTVVLGTEAWFRIRAPRPSVVEEWTTTLPTRLDAFQEIELTRRESRLLRPDEQQCGAWTDPDASEWTVYYFRWLPGTISSRVRVRAHRPEVCLLSSGRTLSRELGFTRFRVGGLSIPFRRYVFDDSGRPMYVFFCLWEDGAENLPATELLRLRDRVRAAWAGIRTAGQRTLEIIVTGVDSERSAEERVARRLPELVRVVSKGPDSGPQSSSNRSEGTVDARTAFTADGPESHETADPNPPMP